MNVVPSKERIAKIIARAGVCSRRDAEKLIQNGRISVDGKILDSPAFTVTGHEDIRLDGKKLKSPESTRLWRYHKPTGLITSHRDEKDRNTVFANLPATLPRVISIGRLDIATEGLLLLTNDGVLSRKLELPQTGWTRRYRVRAFGTIDQAKLDALKTGITVDGIKYAGIDAKLDRLQGANLWLTISLTEGKNREIKKILTHLGLKVNRLIRLSYGPFQLGNLKKGDVEEIPASTLAEQLGYPVPGQPVQPGSGKAKSTKKPKKPVKRSKSARVKNAHHRR